MACSSIGLLRATERFLTAAIAAQPLRRAEMIEQQRVQLINPWARMTDIKPITCADMLETLDPGRHASPFTQDARASLSSALLDLVASDASASTSHDTKQQSIPNLFDYLTDSLWSALASVDSLENKMRLLAEFVMCQLGCRRPSEPTRVLAVAIIHEASGLHPHPITAHSHVKQFATFVALKRKSVRGVETLQRFPDDPQDFVRLYPHAYTVDQPPTPSRCDKVAIIERCTPAITPSRSSPVAIRCQPVLHDSHPSAPSQSFARDNSHPPPGTSDIFARFSEYLRSGTPPHAEYLRSSNSGPLTILDYRASPSCSPPSDWQAALQCESPLSPVHAFAPLSPLLANPLANPLSPPLLANPLSPHVQAQHASQQPLLTNPLPPHTPHQEPITPSCTQHQPKSDMRGDISALRQSVRQSITVAEARLLKRPAAPDDIHNDNTPDDVDATDGSQTPADAAAPIGNPDNGDINGGDVEVDSSADANWDRTLSTVERYQQLKSQHGLNHGTSQHGEQLVGLDGHAHRCVRCKGPQPSRCAPSSLTRPARAASVAPWSRKKQIVLPPSVIGSPDAGIFAKIGQTSIMKDPELVAALRAVTPPPGRPVPSQSPVHYLGGKIYYLGAGKGNYFRVYKRKSDYLEQRIRCVCGTMQLNAMTHGT